MPAAQFSTMKVDALRKKAIALVQSDTISAQQKANNIKAVKAMTKAQLVDALVAFQQDEAKKKAAAQQQAKKKSAKSQKKTSSKRSSAKQKVTAQRQKSKARIAKIRATAKQTTKKRREQSATKPMRSRAGKIMRAIKAGTVAAKQGKMKPGDYTTGTSREKYTKFIELYSDVRITKKRRAKKTVNQVFAQIQGQKFPYMIKKARRIPARVGAIPGTKATPFNQLEEAEQRKVVSFLNTEKAKKLRQKGAPREVSFQKLTAKKGAANR
jgi:hypothetical protein